MADLAIYTEEQQHTIRLCTAALDLARKQLGLLVYLNYLHTVKNSLIPRLERPVAFKKLRPPAPKAQTFVLSWKGTSLDTDQLAWQLTRLRHETAPESAQLSLSFILRRAGRATHNSLTITARIS